MAHAAVGEVRHLCEDVEALGAIIGKLVQADGASECLFLEASVTALRQRLDRLCDIAVH